MGFDYPSPPSFHFVAGSRRPASPTCIALGNNRKSSFPACTHLHIQDSERGRRSCDCRGEARGAGVADVVLADVEHRERPIALRGSARAQTQANSKTHKARTHRQFEHPPLTNRTAAAHRAHHANIIGVRACPRIVSGAQAKPHPARAYTAANLQSCSQCRRSFVAKHALVQVELLQSPEQATVCGGSAGSTVPTFADMIHVLAFFD